MVCLKSLKTPLSESLSSSLPVTISFEFIFTLSQIHRVTSSLSPVNTTTRIPALFNFSMADFADSFGGSKKPIKPKRTISFSSSTSKIVESCLTLFFWQTAITLKPSLLSFFEICLILSLI